MKILTNEFMTLQYARIDSATLVAKDNKMNLWIVWAGCHYGPSKSLGDICNGELFEQASALLQSPDTIWETKEAEDWDDGLGLRMMESD